MPRGLSAGANGLLITGIVGDPGAGCPEAFLVAGANGVACMETLLACV